MKIALCQLNPVMGDIAGNVRKIGAALDGLKESPVDLAVFSELIVQGYPPRDLLECDWFVEQSMRAVDRLCEVSRSLPQTGILAGCAAPTRKKRGKGLHNAALLISGGRVVFRQNKSLLPTYDVFDETRYFDPADRINVFPFKGEKLGITICEDAWNHADMWARPLYRFEPVDYLARKGATLLVNISGSPFHSGKEALRHQIMRRHAVDHRLPFVFVNQVGGDDELIFDGDSMFYDAAGALRERLPSFAECVRVIDTARPGPAIPEKTVDEIANIHDALVLGIGDYMRKCGFTGALVGLSGGIDSAVTAALGVAALGNGNVYGVGMPSRYSSEGSVADARLLAQNLGIHFEIVPIEKPFAALLETLSGSFAGKPADLAEENLQARIRGTILMALSNKHGRLLLTTGNKSEMSVGYCTLYGDMNGGLAVIADLPKTTVYRLARYINREREIIPAASITKPPSAELRPGQTDQDTLPPYETLDRILTMLVEENRSRDEIAAAGLDRDTVDRVARMVRLSEYKRRQAAPVLKVTPKAFGSGRRFPIAAKYEW